MPSSDLRASIPRDSADEGDPSWFGDCGEDAGTRPVASSKRKARKRGRKPDRVQRRKGDVVWRGRSGGARQSERSANLVEGDANCGALALNEPDLD